MDLQTNIHKLNEEMKVAFPLGNMYLAKIKFAYYSPQYRLAVTIPVSSTVGGANRRDLNLETKAA